MKFKTFLFQLICLGILGAVSTTGLAGSKEEAELDDIAARQEQMNLKKEWAKYRLDDKQNKCYQKFFTSSCLDDAQLEYRKELKAIREQEVLMHDRQRALKAIIKDEKYQERQVNRADPQKAEERRQNVQSYEQKQLEAAKRQADVDKKRSDAAQRAQENNK